MATLTAETLRASGWNYRNATSKEPLYFFGYEVPSNVYCLSHWYDAEQQGTVIGWTTTSGKQHVQLLPSEGSHDDIIALLVTMRMSD